MGWAEVVVVVALIGGSSEAMVELALEKAGEVLKTWREGHLDKPDVSLRRADDGAGAADRTGGSMAEGDGGNDDSAAGRSLRNPAARALS
jgi:hypothetical protein